jgi:hypothetical protein
MAKLTPHEIRDLQVKWIMQFPSDLNLRLFEKFTGVSMITYTADTFIPDACLNRIKILDSPHALTLIKLWEIQNAEKD